ncbi:MAG TPA: hypothetical protein PLP29_13040 [Candidatus Ozemobacteraceae bacterium]|nr:hypothetical protein [Candidatus Ozemobacteraceae bacterium]
MTIPFVPVSPFMRSAPNRLNTVVYVILSHPRCLFTMFAEDAELVERGTFTTHLHSLLDECNNFPGNGCQLLEEHERGWPVLLIPPFTTDISICILYIYVFPDGGFPVMSDWYELRTVIPNPHRGRPHGSGRRKVEKDLPVPE